ncbi:Amd2p [Sugiyamaella lignohabitans]|uniref:Amd2p n=1 Tax=Sugiyamaella lignohabitans TaxID=796027 RepID=A0A167F253_9ASCO|nr:Amd2p [Sugiyamaella lignohabitans]ANB14728.1 Amd2p [Sugiyamaella lignohabitans]
MATDIGGSIRFPAYANGVYGFKPSSGRVPYYNIKGYWPPGEEYNGVLCVAGPIAVSMRDCELIIKAIAETEPWKYDPTCIYSPWPKQKTLAADDKRPLSIGVVRGPTAEPITSILAEACKKITDAGHELVEMEIINGPEMLDLTTKIFQVDGGKFLVDLCSTTNEPLTKTVIDNGLYPCEPADLSQFFAYSHRRIELQKAWAEYWEQSAGTTASGKPVDILLMPISPFVPRVREFLSSPFINVWNLLDYPALTFTADKINLSKHKVEIPPPSNIGETNSEQYCKYDSSSNKKEISH